jgi:hypothetical protein
LLGIKNYSNWLRGLSQHANIKTWKWEYKTDGGRPSRYAELDKNEIWAYLRSRFSHIKTEIGKAFRALTNVFQKTEEVVEPITEVIDYNSIPVSIPHSNIYTIPIYHRETNQFIAPEEILELDKWTRLREEHNQQLKAYKKRKAQKESRLQKSKGFQK